jgi:hypothetical protein
MNRKLIDGTVVSGLPEPQVLTITTKCVEKWLLTDRETSEIYTPYATPGISQWKKIDYATWAPPEINNA